MKPLIFKLKPDVYPYTVLFYIGEKPSDATVGRVCKGKLWNGEGNPPTAGNGTAGTTTFGSGCFVWIPPYNKTPAWFGSFTHELCHVLADMSEHLGCWMEPKTDEFHAYYASWLTEEVMKRVLLTTKK